EDGLYLDDRKISNTERNIYSGQSIRIGQDFINITMELELPEVYKPSKLELVTPEKKEFRPESMKPSSLQDEISSLRPIVQQLKTMVQEHSMTQMQANPLLQEPASLTVIDNHFKETLEAERAEKKKKIENLKLKYQDLKTKFLDLKKDN